MRLGKHQLRMLMVMGSPTMRLITPNETSRALAKRGLITDRDGGAFRITAAGLRALADEMDAGRIASTLTDMRKEQEQGVARK